MLSCRLLLLAGLATARASNAEALTAFRAWLAGRGAIFSAGLDFGTDAATGLRGLLATKPIAEGEELFSIPSELILTLNRVRELGTAWRKCTKEGKDEEFLSHVHTAFALFILEQRSSGAAWQPWVSVLPESFGSLPLFLKEGDLAHLQASPLRKVVELDQNAVEGDHRRSEACLGGLTLAEFQWARACVKSRVFSLRSLSGGRLHEETVAMVPMADFVNHPPDGKTTENSKPDYDPDTGIFRFTATRAISEREGIYWDYGFKSNRNSLQRYGFASEGRVALTDMTFFVNLLAFPGSEGAVKEKKLAMIKQAQDDGVLAMDPDGTVLHEFALGLSNLHASRLLGHMRFQVFNPKDLKSLDDFCTGTYCRPISLQTERLALERLSELALGLLGRYGTTAEQDKSIIAKGIDKLGAAPYFLTLIRFGEKRILKGFGNVVRAIDPLFDLAPWALEKAVREKWKDDKSDIHKYVQRNVTELVELEAMRWVKKRVKAQKGAAPKMEL